MIRHLALTSRAAAVAAFLVAAGTGDAESNGNGTVSLPRLVVPIGHVNGIHALAFSADSAFIATAGYDRTARVWEAATNLELAAYPHPGAVQAVAFTPNARALVTGDVTGLVHVWDRDSGSERYRRRHSAAATGGRFGGAGVGGVTTVAVSPDGATIVSGGPDGVKFWRTSDGQPVALDAALAQMRVSSLAFSHGGTLLALGAANGLFVWSVARHTMLPGYSFRPAVLPGTTPSNGIASVTFSADDRVVSGGFDHIVRSWSNDGGTQLLADAATAIPWSVAISKDGATLAAPSELGAHVWRNGLPDYSVASEPIRAVAFSPDGNRLVVGEMSSPRSWDAHTWEPLDASIPEYRAPLGVIASDNGRQLLFTSTGRAAVWDTRSGREVARLPIAGSDPRDASFTRDGALLAYVHLFRRKAVVWSAETASPVRTFEAQLARTTAIATDRDATTIVTADDDGAVRIWDRASRRLSHVFAAEPIERTEALAVSPDGKTFASARGSNVYVRRIADGKNVGPPFAHRFAVKAVAFAPSGHELATAETGDGVSSVHLWDTATGRETSPPLAGGDAVAYSNDNRIVSERRNTVFVYDAKTHEPLNVFTEAESLTDATANAPAGAGAIALSDGGKLLSGGSSSRVARIRDGAGNVVATLTGQKGPFTAATFSANGQRAITAGADGIVRTWDAATGREIAHVPVFRLAGVARVGPLHQVVVSGDVVPRVLDERSLRESGPFVKHQARIDGVALSRDGRLLLTYGDDQGAFVWDVKSGKELRLLNGSSGVTSVAFSPDGQRAVTGGADGFLRLWRVADGQQIGTIRAQQYAVGSVAWSSRGRIAAGGPFEHAIRTWESDLSGVAREAAAEKPLTYLTFSSDGTRLLANGGTWHYGRADDAHEAIVYDAESLHELRRVQPLGAGVDAAAFVGNARIIATGHDDGTVALWDWAHERVLCTYVSLPNDEFAVYEPQGPFEVSSFDRVAGLHWVLPGASSPPLPVDVFARNFLTPHLLRSAITGGTQLRAAPIQQLNRALPHVEIQHVVPEPGGTSVSVDVHVDSGTASWQRDPQRDSLLSGVYDLRLFRDEQLVAQSPAEDDATSSGRDPAGLAAWRREHTVVTKGSAGTITFQHVPISRTADARHTFAAYAFNGDRLKSITSRVIYRRPPPDPPPPRKRAYLIAMGVDDNESHWLSSFAAASAHDAVDLFEPELKRSYDDVVRVRLEAATTVDPAVRDKRQAALPATKKNLHAVLDVLAGRDVGSTTRDLIDPNRELRAATPDDAVIVYVASHGFVDPAGRFYVIPYDTGHGYTVSEQSLTRCAKTGFPKDRCSAEATFLARSISSQDFTSWLRGVDGGDLTIILDTCFAAAAEGIGFRPGPLGDATFGQLSYDKRIRLFAATQADKTAAAGWSGAHGRTVLMDTLYAVHNGTANDPAASFTEIPVGKTEVRIARWLRVAARTLPGRARTVNPGSRAELVQFPELLDVERTARPSRYHINMDCIPYGMSLLGGTSC